MVLETTLQQENDNFFIEVNDLFKYYSNNTQELNLNNYEELTTTYKNTLNLASIDLIKGYLTQHKRCLKWY